MQTLFGVEVKVRNHTCKFDVETKFRDHVCRRNVEGNNPQPHLQVQEYEHAAAAMERFLTSHEYIEMPESIFGAAMALSFQANRR